MSHVSTTLEGDHPVLSVMKRMRPEEMDGIITSTVDRLRQLAAAAGLTVTGDPFGVFHGPITTDSDGPLEIVLPVDDLADMNNDVRSYRLPGGMVANRFAEGAEPPSRKSLGSTMSSTVGSPKPDGCRSGHPGRPGTTADGPRAAPADHLVAVRYPGRPTF